MSPSIGEGAREGRLMSGEVILQAENLVKYYPIKAGVLRRTVGHVKALDGVSFDLYKGETLGIVGESGCGKSTLGRMLMRLEEPTSGKLTFDGVDVYTQKGAAMRKLRRDIQIVFQDPYTSLNPRKTVGDIIGEPYEIHTDVLPKGGRRRRGAGAARPGRAESRAHQPLPAPVLRRPAAADRDRPWTGPQPEGDHLRRAGLGIGRLGPGPGGQPAGEICSRSSGWPTSSSPTTCRWSGTSPTGSA